MNSAEPLVSAALPDAGSGGLAVGTFTPPGKPCSKARKDEPDAARAGFAAAPAKTPVSVPA